MEIILRKADKTNSGCQNINKSAIKGCSFTNLFGLLVKCFSLWIYSKQSTCVVCGMFSLWFFFTPSPINVPLTGKAVTHVCGGETSVSVSGLNVCGLCVDRGP